MIKVFSAQNSPRARQQEVLVLVSGQAQKALRSFVLQGLTTKLECGSPCHISTMAVLSPGEGRGRMFSHFLCCSSELATDSSHDLMCTAETVRATASPPENRDKISFLPLFVLSIQMISPFTCKRCCETRQPEFLIMYEYQQLNYGFGPAVLPAAFHLSLCIWMGSWMLKQKLCRHNGCPSALTENQKRFDKFGVFFTEANKNIH